MSEILIPCDYLASVNAMFETYPGPHWWLMLQADWCLNPDILIGPCEESG